MRHSPRPRLDELRHTHPKHGRTPDGTDFGFFVLGPLRIISGGSGERWEHVSVSCADRTPTWDEMSQVKALFWGDDETVLQFHPRRSEYVDEHPYCLHLWRRRRKNHPLPPRQLI